MNRLKIPKKKAKSPFKILTLGFLLIIFVGTVILSLPISSNTGTSTNILDSFFTATSSVCVTGLITLDTASHWSMFGKTVIMFLIEIGGLGFMALTTILALILGKKITLKERLVMQEAYNTFNIQGIIKHVIYLLVFTISVQAIAAFTLMTQFIPLYGTKKGVFFGIFHSVSAFCNAGFDLLGDYTSFTVLNHNKVILLTLTFLIIIGGLGYTVWREIFYNIRNKRSFEKLSLHSKVVITMSFGLIAFATFLFLIAEWNNPGTMKGMSFGDKLVNSYFSAVTPRTAGFNSISNTAMSGSGKVITMIYMFIGGSPGSTAGGIKTTTLAIIIFTVISLLRNREETEIYRKTIIKSSVYKALTVFILGIGVVVLGIMLLSVTEKNTPFEHIVYEVISAFGTVGLTEGLTQSLTSPGKIIIAVIMYLGRLGPITVMLAFSNTKQKVNIKYPEDKLLIG